MHTESPYNAINLLQTSYKRLSTTRMAALGSVFCDFNASVDAELCTLLGYIGPFYVEISLYSGSFR